MGGRMVQKVQRREGGPTLISHHSGPPPPLIIDRKERGVWNETSAVDLGILIAVVGKVRARFWTPPPLKGRMEGGVRNPLMTIDLGM
jgi:hypothetical protein